MPPGPADDEVIVRGTVRVWSVHGEVIGSGFLLGADLVCTCAHVVAQALGTDETDVVPPSDPVCVDFPLLSEVRTDARAVVERWVPVRADGGGDIALLRLPEPVPGTGSLPLAGDAPVWGHPFRVLGFPRHSDHGVWVSGRLRAPVGNGWTAMETRPSPWGAPIGKGFSGAPVWDLRQGGVVGMTVAADHGEAATTAYLIPAATLLALDPASRTCPFRGLQAFREEDASVFHGRTRDSVRIADAVADTAFVPVAGASGVGKSSLVRAGVLPLLRGAGYTVTDFVRQPGANPTRVLLTALRGQFPRAVLLAELAGEVCANADSAAARAETAVLFAAHLLQHAGHAGHVVLLDQFEEVVGAHPDQARELLDTLLAMTRATGPDGRRLRVLATLRSASLEDLVVSHEPETLSVRVQMLAPMSAGQLAEIISAPVRSLPGTAFETGLPERILADAGADVGHAPGALPMIEFVLAQLWERRTNGLLTHCAYQEIGGVWGALSTYAEQRLAMVCRPGGRLDETAARRLFEQLAIPTGEAGYGLTSLALADLPGDLRAAADILADSRLVVLGRDSAGQETVTLAHESLVRAWPRLRSWLDESRDFRAWQEQFRRRLGEWRDGDRDPALLLQGRDLTTARVQAGKHSTRLTEREREFLAASQRRHRRGLVRSRTAVGLVTALCVLAGLLILAVQRADDRQAAERDSERLAALSDEYAQRDPVNSVFLALAARGSADTPRAYEALLRQYQRMSSVSKARPGFVSGAVRSIKASRDAGRLAVLYGAYGRSQVVSVSGIHAAHPAERRLAGTPAETEAVAVSDDGSRIAAATSEGRIVVWAADSGERIADWRWKPGKHAAATEVLDFSADGRRLLHFMSHNNYDTVCGEKGETRTRLHLREIDAAKTVSLPDGLLGADECPDTVALPAGSPAASNESILVISGFDVPVPGEQNRVESRYSVRLADVDTGQPVWKKQSLHDVVAGSGGRTLAFRQPDGSWTFHSPTSAKPVPAGGRAWGVEESDATGRYFGKSGQGTFGEGEATLAFWHDSGSGKRHSGVLPYTQEPVGVVVSEDRGRTFMVTAQGADVLYALMEETHHPFPGFDPSSAMEDMALSCSGKRIAALVPTEKAKAVLSIAMPGNALRNLEQRTVHVEADHSTHPLFSNDSTTLLTHGYSSWGLYEVNGLHEIERVSGPGDEIISVQPFGDSDFLLLDSRGLHRLDGTTGKLSDFEGPKCAPPSPGPQSRTCTHLVARPAHHDDFLLVRGDGVAELWHLPPAGEQRIRSQSHRIPEYAAAAEDSALFNAEGDTAAVLTNAGLALWQPGLGREVRHVRVAGLSSIAAFSKNRITMYVSRNPGGYESIEIWDTAGRRIAGLTSLTNVAVWEFRSSALHGYGLVGPVSVPLESGPLVARLCQAVGDRYPPTVRNQLRPEAPRQPPCPTRD
ncbi:serine protease [Streptomyces sp. ISL-24]|uniref:nSTAND1 domain-containing NTPase n=1 Tax=unclassified Streptomyces TaxID=2593676 RepID=UPI001BEA7012